MDRSYRFWNLLAQRYARTPIADEQAYQEKLRLICEHLHDKARVLEFGCGTGSTAVALAPRCGSYLALDYSERMVDIGRGKATEEGLVHLQFECASITDFEASAAAFDTVLGMNVLHLLDDWRETIDKVFALLAPGGVFCSSTACLADMDTPARHLARLRGLMGFLPRLSVFSHEQLAAKLVDAGFEISHDWQPGENKAVFIAAFKPD